MSPISKWTAALLLASSAAFAGHENLENRYVLDVSHKLALRGGRLSVDHKFGSIVIRTHQGDSVLVRGAIRSSDPDFGRQIRISAVETAGGVTVKTDYPDHKRMKKLSFSVDYQITVPERAAVTLRNRFGTIDVSGVSSSDIVNAHGSVVVRKTRGAQRIENAFASIDLADNEGPVNIRNQYGSVAVRAVSGDLELGNRFGSVTVSTAKGKTSIHNNNGSVSARDIGGPLSIVNAYGTVSASGVRGPATVRNNNGRVYLRDIGGPATIGNAFGQVVAHSIAGALSANGQNMSVDARDIRGPVTLRTSFGSAFVDGVSGTIDIKNQNGAIAVSGVRGRCQRISLRSSFGSIRIKLPASADFDVNARTTFGTIQSALPVGNSSATDESLVGTLGSGGCPLELVNQNGAITIEKE